MPEFDAVILAGGKAARMGGPDKPALEVGGQALLVTVARAAAEAGAARLVVVGPERAGPIGRALAGLPGEVVTVREKPAGHGPVPALRRGIAEVTAGWVALLAADLPFLTSEWLPALLLQARGAGAAGAVLADSGGRPQWLAGCWRSSVLLTALSVYQGDSLGGLLRPLSPVLVGPRSAAYAAVAGERVPAQPPWLDCDDPAELAAARAVASKDRPGREAPSGDSPDCADQDGQA